MDTLDAVEAQAPTDAPAEPAQEHTYSLAFTGSGSEYFRIWIVNLALTVATFGIYSAWAKVRRLQYFYRNTLLDDCAFNFHAEPKAILRGRILAVAIALAYHYAFGFSLEVGIAVVVSLVLGLPFLMMNALRFRLRYTSYRGLRFGFGGRAPAAYARYAPVVIMFVLPGALAAIPNMVEYAAASTLLYLCWPGLHAGMKRYQQGNLRYAQAESAYSGSTRAFFVVYLKALGLVLLGVIPVVIVAIGVGALLQYGAGEDSRWARFVPMLIGALMAYVMYLVTGPYIMARIGNHVWNHTRIAGVSFESTLSAGKLNRLQTKNVLLTLFTLGLYRPFAVVSVHRYRIANVTIRSEQALRTVLGTAQTPAPGAAGDGAVDMLGFDLSW